MDLNLNWDLEPDYDQTPHECAKNNTLVNELFRAKFKDFTNLQIYRLQMLNSDWLPSIIKQLNTNTMLFFG